MVESLSRSYLDELQRKPESARIAYAATEIQKICNASPHSQYFPYGGEGYKSSVRHYLESSTEVAYAAVQPGNAEDLSKIVGVLRDTKAPFAVKGGGHATNPNFSSTKGIQISMARFNKTEYNEGTQALVVGAGCLFDEIYSFLDGTGRGIVGGSAIAGIGIAGWLLGGGYSLKTNQYGLGIENILDIKMVLPSNGAIIHVNKEISSGIFDDVRGGGNNFGIVTEFTLATHPQSDVYGDTLVFGDHQVKDVKIAIEDFARDYKDPKASIVAAFRYFNKGGRIQFKLTVQYFYNAPQPQPPNPFQKFFDIHSLSAGQQQPVASKSYFDLDHAFSRIHDGSIFDVIVEHDNTRATAPKPPMAGIGENARGRWGNVMVSRYTRNIIDEVEKQAQEAADHLAQHGGLTVVVDIWPFHQRMSANNDYKAAWPPKTSHSPNGPLLVYFQWEGKENDAFWIGQMKDTLTALEAIVSADEENQHDRPVYSNTALFEHATVQSIYGENLGRLRASRMELDPLGVMDQTGGFRIPLPFRG